LQNALDITLLKALMYFSQLKKLIFEKFKNFG